MPESEDRSRHAPTEARKTKSTVRGGMLNGAEFAGIGVQFALTILVFTFAGAWLDRRLSTTPWLLIICLFAGAAGGFYSMYRRVTAAQRREAEDRAARRSHDEQSGGGAGGGR